jgi:type II secretory pathway component GspD/PulD (secretin)
LDRDTIFVAPDNPTVRAGFLGQTTKAINLNKVQQLSGIEIVTALRTLLNFKQVSALENSIVIQDTAENVAIAERVVADLDSPRSR